MTEKEEEKEKFRAAMRVFVDKCVNAVVGV